jgi:hypothetical protein
MSALLTKGHIQRVFDVGYVCSAGARFWLRGEQAIVVAGAILLQRLRRVCLQLENPECVLRFKEESACPLLDVS